MVAEHSGDIIGVESGSVNHAACFDGLFLEMRFVADADAGANAAAGGVQRGDPRMRDEIGAAFRSEACKGPDEILGGKNAGGRDLERGGAADVRLARANFGSGNEAKAFDSIFLAALLQREQLRLFLGLRRNDELPRMAVRDVVPLAKFIIETVAFHAEARLQCVHRIVDPGVNYSGVARARGHAGPGILLGQKDIGIARGGGVSDRAADNAAADDEDVGSLHGYSPTMRRNFFLPIRATYSPGSLKSMRTVGSARTSPLISTAFCLTRRSASVVEGTWPESARNLVQRSLPSGEIS